MSNKYINLKVNGRLFPSWILLNFNKYKLPDVFQKSDDPKNKKTKLELQKYQSFLAAYLDFKSPYKEILLYHGLGSGKTATVINLINILYNYSPYWNIYIIIKASIKGNWLNELSIWLNKDEYENRFKNIKFINYDSPYADRDFLDSIRDSESSNKSLFIIDEAHNFINNVYNNIVSKTGRRAFTIYDHIQQTKIDDSDTRIVLMTGTPAINNPYEIALIFNLLRPNIFPNNELKFMESYVKGGILQDEKKNMFQRRIMGLVSYYSGTDRSLFAEKRVKFINVTMSDYQEEIYEHYEEIEKKIDSAKNRSRDKSKKTPSTYKSFTRQSSIFIFPVIKSGITGETRPRPSKFRVSSFEIQKLMQGENVNDETKNNKGFIEYNESLLLFIKELKGYFNKINNKDTANKNSINNDVEIFKKVYKYNFEKFWKEHKKKSELLKQFYECSCKITYLIFNLLSTKGPALIFSNYVRMEGLEIIKVYLSYLGFSKFINDNSKSHFSYTEFHGNISMQEREKNKKNFNRKDNIYGKIIKIIMIAPAGSEGISLRNVRQVHILDPHWNEVRIEQVIGRAIRQNSHSDLPEEERYVDVFRYIAIRKNKKQTTDENIQGLANKKKMLIDSFLTPMKEVAVDCELFRSHNIKNKEYECFKFNENSLFDKQIGPAYKVNPIQDIKIDNGLNSENSIVKSIKVYKIKAVKKLSEDKFSEIGKFKLNFDNGIVYDYEFNIAIGKIILDKDGIPMMKDDNTYIISELIPIPILDKY